MNSVLYRIHFFHNQISNLNPNPNFYGPFSGYAINEKHADKILDEAYFNIFTIVEK